MSIIKIIMTIFGVSTYIFFMSYIYINSTIVQSCVLLLILIGFLMRFSTKDLLAELRMLTSLAIIWLIIWIIIALLNIKLTFVEDQNSNETGFWVTMTIGINTIMNFINTVYFLKIVLSFVSVNDFLKVPLKYKYLKYIILGKILFEQGNHAIRYIELYISNFPDQKIFNNDTFIKNAKKRFKKNLIILLALIFYILQESVIKGKLIDNRIKHCFDMR